ncbi:MAG: SUMF1/EgtB/PvdO family nonheme iron enzyme [Ignavibacteria bacterium]|nr:SUMF1/EgtB/PvdO family nonheme iron enzyme [Ignavibacteria bacterium]
MKRIWFVLLVIGLSMSAFSQAKMFINKFNGTTDSLLLSDFKSISYKSGSSTPNAPSDLIQVAGGTFQMGINVPANFANPPHPVTLSAFYIDKTEITYEQWAYVRSWALTHGYTDLPVGSGATPVTGPNFPVTYVSWYDVVKWCNARSEMNGLTPVYYTRSTNTINEVYRTGELDLDYKNAVEWNTNGYRLPTEAEWEFAARGGTKSLGYIYSGSHFIDIVAWYSGNAVLKVHPVSTKGANELGIYDMSGNVREWCWDWAADYSSTAVTDPKGPASVQQYRELRGGSFDGDASSCLAGSRYDMSPSFPNPSVGFRCVRR